MSVFPYPWMCVCCVCLFFGVFYITGKYIDKWIFCHALSRKPPGQVNTVAGHKDSPYASCKHQISTSGFAIVGTAMHRIWLFLATVWMEVCWELFWQIAQIIAFGRLTLAFAQAVCHKAIMNTILICGNVHLTNCPQNCQSAQ